MDLELMFSDQKWNILRCLSNEKQSPLQLAERLDTTMANISQQLRLLQATNLVKREKIKNREKGKPRALFSLNNDTAYLISTMHQFADKKLLRLKEHHKAVLKIMYLENETLHEPLQQLYWRVYSHLSSVSGLFFDEQKECVIIVSNKVEYFERIGSKSTSFSVKVMDEDEAKRKVRLERAPFDSPLIALHNPKGLI